MANLTIPSRSRIRRDFNNATLRNYWETKTEALQKINEVLKQHDVFVDYDHANFNGDDGRAVLDLRADKDYRAICDACTKDVAFPAFDNVVAYSWYKMPSGKFEITTYIS